MVGPIKRIAVLSLIILSSFIFQLKSYAIFGFRIDAILAALIALSFLLPFFQFIFVVLLADFLLIWHPVVQIEEVLIAALPLFLFLFNRIIIYLESIIAVYLVSFLSILIFYIALFRLEILNSPNIIYLTTINAAIGGLIAVSVLQVYKYLLSEKETTI